MALLRKQPILLTNSLEQKKKSGTCLQVGLQVRLNRLF